VAQSFIKYFDKGLTVKPITFKLYDIPARAK
jgi:hypothetical protein